jgi:hypothetical protein
MLISWIKKLFVKTSPVEVGPAALEESPARKPETETTEKPEDSLAVVVNKFKQVKKAKSGAPRKRVENLKSKPCIRVGESKSNFERRLKRWNARNDAAKAKSNPRPDRPRVPSRRSKDTDQS